MDPVNLSQGLPFREPTHDLVVTTDASMEGWGGHSLVQGKTLLFSGLWSQKERRSCHINLLELRALRLTLLRIAPHIANCTVKLECDNSTAVSYVNKQGGTRSWTLCQEAVELHDWLNSQNTRVFAVHRRGIHNELADYLSRTRPDPTEWAQSDNVAQLLFKHWGTPMIDLFASELNHKRPLWFSRSSIEGAAGTNAFAQTWKGWYVYAFPPTNLILKTLTKVREEEVEAIVLVPHWPRRDWFPLLLQMATEQPVMFHKRMDLLSQTLSERGVLFHPDLESLQLTAWKLNGALGKVQGSARKSSLLPWRPKETRLVRSTMENGAPTSSGAMTMNSSLYKRL